MHIHGHGTGQKPVAAFTALELLVTVSVACILLLTGVPSLTQFSRQQKMKAAIGHLHNDLLMARSEAVTRSVSAVACPGSPASGCSGGSEWTGGWIVFADMNGDQQFQGGEPLVRRGQPVDHVRILGTAGRREIRFFPNGSAPGSNSSITFCGAGGPAEARRLVISNVGRIRRDSATDIDPVKCPDKA